MLYTHDIAPIAQGKQFKIQLYILMTVLQMTNTNFIETKLSENVVNATRLE